MERWVYPARGVLLQRTLRGPGISNAFLAG